MAQPHDTLLIGLDWGTTALRAYRLGADGAVLEKREAALGILNVEDGDFAGAMDSLIGDWRRDHAGIPLLASGMIGSRQGLREVTYCQTPAGTEALSAGISQAPFDGGVLHIVPGLATTDSDGVPDVMRGEETQIVGVLPPDDRAFCCILPGTHSKWVAVRESRIETFATFMTGELFAVLKQHSILGRGMRDGKAASDAFARGLRAGQAKDGLLHPVFGVRTLGLMGRLADVDTADYLSGLLIGSEFREARAWLGARDLPIVLVGGGASGARYGEALELAGVAAEVAAPDAAARGLFRLARAAGLIEA